MNEELLKYTENNRTEPYKNKTVLLCVSGGIAVYKAADLASRLVKAGCTVHVLMTEHATEFVTPLTFSALTKTRTIVDMFDPNHSWKIEHIALAEQADLLLVAPATANILAKLACGMADDMLTTTALACRCPKMAVPAMNTNMYENPVTQHNLKILREYGWEIVEPDSGHLACGSSGKGRFPEPEVLTEAALHALRQPKDLFGLRILVTAGPTQEALDPVRYLTNHSTGTMGYAIARAAASRGAEVTLVTGPTSLRRPKYMEVVEIVSAQDMFEAVTSRSASMNWIIKAAAVADYRPQNVSAEKIKKQNQNQDLMWELERTQDILAWLGAHKNPGQILCGFSMETQNLVENSRKKLETKNVDMIAANSIRDAGAGFGPGTNILTLLTREHTEMLPIMSKDAAAEKLLDALLACYAAVKNNSESESKFSTVF